MEKVTKRKVFAASASAALVASAVVPAATFAATADFTDISNLPEAEQAAINALVKDGIINGKGDGKFDPFAQMKRAEAATIVAKLLKLDVDNAPSANFDDVSKDYWAKKYIDAAVSAGVLEGKGEGKFDPETPMKRSEFAQLVVKTFGLERVAGVKHKFNDVPDSYWGKEAIEILYSNGLINGKTETRFAPEERMQRNHVALLIQRAIDPNVFEFKIESVTGLDETNRFLQINFTQKVDSLEPSDITIENAKSKERYGVKEVNLASNGLTAQIELFSHEGKTMILENNTDYKVTVKANGKTLEYIFNRPAFVESRIVSIDVENNRFNAVDEKTGAVIPVKVPKDSNFNYQEALGEKVSVWYNGERELVDFEITSKSAVYDAVEIEKGKVKLLSKGTKYDISKEEYINASATNAYKAKLYVDGKEVKLDEAQVTDPDYVNKRYNFAKVGYNNAGDIEFVSAYSLNEVLVVDRINGKEIIGIEGDASGSFDAKDATIVKNGKIISLDDIEKGDVLFFSNSANGNDGYAEVLNNTVTGEISDTFLEAIRVDGKTYNFIHDEDDNKKYAKKDYSRAVYLNDNNKLEYIDEDSAEELQAAGDVILYLDRAGNLVYVSGDTAEVSKNTKTSILLEDIAVKKDFNNFVAQLEIVNQDGDEKLYQVVLDNLNTITVDGKDYKIKKNPSTSKNDEAKVVYTEVGNKLTLENGDVKATIELNKSAGKLVNVKLDDDGKVKGLEFFTKDETDAGYGEHVKQDNPKVNALEAGDKYVGGKRLLDSTVVFDAKKGFKENDKVDLDAKDVKVSKWGDYKGSAIDKAYYIYNDDNEVIALVIKETSASETVEEAAVITNVLKNSDGKVVEITAFVKGQKQTYKVDDVDFDLKKGSIVVLEFDKDNSNVVDNITEAGNFEAKDKIVDTVDSGRSEVTFTDTKKVRLVSGGLVLDATDKSDIKVKNLSDLRSENIKVTVVYDEENSQFAKYFVYEKITKDEYDKLKDQTTPALNAKTGLDKTVDEGSKDLVFTASDLATTNIGTLNFVDNSAKSSNETAATATIEEGKLVVKVSDELETDAKTTITVEVTNGSKTITVTFDVNVKADTTNDGNETDEGDETGGDNDNDNENETGGDE